MPQLTNLEHYAGMALQGLAARLSDADFIELKDGIRPGGHEARVAMTLATALCKEMAGKS